MRKLLILSSSSVDETLLQKIAAADWEIYLAQDMGVARTLLTAHTFEVGLGILTHYDAEHPAQWITELVTARRNIQWVLAVARQCLDRKAFINLITERCYDYHTLPIDAERLISTIGHAYGMSVLSESILRQQRDIESQFGMIGNSPVMQTLFRSIQKAAEVDVPVLITGESGTGKEQAARSIHEYSNRSAAPFVVMNCGALAGNLLQSELFGYEAEAFPGADEQRIGCIETAHDGTLFLDEIGDLSTDAQANLLRFVEEQKVRRLGSSKPLAVDVRVITATNSNLKQAVQEGRFREDLYYRLNALHLRVPLLRERKNDVELLAKHFFNKFAAETRTLARGFSRDALEVISHYDWPGNIRELMNRVRRAVLLSEGPYIIPSDLELERRSIGRGFITLDEARMSADREIIQSTLLRTRFNIARASQELDVSRMTLYRLMEKYDIRRDSI